MIIMSYNKILGCLNIYSTNNTHKIQRKFIMF